MIYAIGIATLAYFVGHVSEPSWAEFLVVPAVFLACNLFEWWIHRYHHASPGQRFHGHLSPPHPGAPPVLHRSRAVPRRRARFPHHLLPALCARDVSRDVGPSAPLSSGSLWSSNAAWLLICTTTAVYLNYEFFHYCCHIRDDRVIRYVPFDQHDPPPSYCSPQSRRS